MSLCREIAINKSIEGYPGPQIGSYSDTTIEGYPGPQIGGYSDTIGPKLATFRSNTLRFINLACSPYK